MSIVDTVGYVDGISGDEIVGWARNRADSQVLSEVNIVSNTGKTLKWKPTHYRADVCKVCGLEGIYGFHVPLSLLSNFGTSFKFLTDRGALLNNGEISLPASDTTVEPVTMPECKIYLHIQKTSGTSIVNVIHNSMLKSRFVSMYPHFGLTLKQLISLPLLQRRSLKLILGHTYFGIDKFIGNNTTYITTMREPMARIRSQFIHILSHSGATYQVAGKDYALHEVISRGLTEEFDNLQVRMIAGLAESEVSLNCVRQDDAELAIENIKTRFNYVNVMEDRSEAPLTVLQHLDIDATEMPFLNRANKDVVEKYKEELDLVDWDVVRERHKPEIALYDFVTGATNGNSDLLVSGTRRTARRKASKPEEVAA